MKMLIGEPHQFITHLNSMHEFSASPIQNPAWLWLNIAPLPSYGPVVACVVGRKHMHTSGRNFLGLKVVKYFDSEGWCEGTVAAVVKTNKGKGVCIRLSTRVHSVHLWLVTIFRCLCP